MSQSTTSGWSAAPALAEGERCRHARRAGHPPQAAAQVHARTPRRSVFLGGGTRLAQTDDPNIDTLVDLLRAEKQVAHERLVGENRDGWLTQVRDRVLSHPALSSS